MRVLVSIVRYTIVCNTVAIQKAYFLKVGADAKYNKGNSQAGKKK
jgi:hypothetical protein